MLFVIDANAQSPYVLNGSAIQDNCHCYTLTKDIEFQSGSIWNKNKIDITMPFDFFFNVNLGCLDVGGADGIAFVLQPISTSLGTVGAGLGFGGVVPSLGVTIDTYQNFDDHDPAYDHIAIQANGDLDHLSSNNLAGPVTALSGNDNIEDCKFHILEVNWQPDTDSLIVSMDGIRRLAIQKNIVADIFNNNPMVYWGFTSATGGSVNVQQMCTSLNANFKLAPHPNTCIGTPLTFLDSSVSFGSIANWYWNFGDGTTSTEKNPPAHNFAAPGIYDVTLNVLSGDGCKSDTFKKQVVISSFPVADFSTVDSPLCTGRSVIFSDASTVIAGTLNYWYWDLGNGQFSSDQSPVPIDYPLGDYDVKLFVKTKEGCASDTVSKHLEVLQSPAISFTKSDGCKDSPIPLDASNLNDTIHIKQWYWNFGDNSFSTDENPTHIFLQPGTYNVSLVAVANNGCISDTIINPVIIYGTNAFAGNDTTILQGYPFQLNASGGEFYSWFPPTGLSDAHIFNPITTLNNDITYTLTASTPVGCATSDTIHLKVVKGPEIYVPTAFTPNGDGLNDKFRIIPVGITTIRYFNIYNRWGQLIFSTKDPSKGWDGTVNGMPQPSGTYVWVAAGISSIDQSLLIKKGTLVLIR
ncbi:MAG: PKD domain-containing protein [Bacteroidetes bacterium]|nr:PKD domain-containing protein [Bacteroidota bacterium]